MIESRLLRAIISRAVRPPRGWVVKSSLQRLISEMQEGGIRLPQAVRALEKEYVSAALQKHRGNRTLAARSLGVHRNTLTHKIRLYRLRD